MTTNPLSIQTQARTGYTHEVVIDHSDFTAATNVQTFTVDVKAGQAVGKAFHRLVEDFDSSDATLTSLLYIAGDGGSTNRFITSTQVSVDGTEIDYKAGALSDVYVYTADDTIDIAFTGTAAKLLSTVNAGKLRILLQIIDSADFAD
tara:strand:+ start:4763 stop:5203 length:441 start_codon:yes stop_codon:yes gene_type:complete